MNRSVPDSMADRRAARLRLVPLLPLLALSACASVLGIEDIKEDPDLNNNGGTSSTTNAQGGDKNNAGSTPTTGGSGGNGNVAGSLVMPAPAGIHRSLAALATATSAVRRTRATRPCAAP
jgi:hypothetical protein